MATLVRDGGRRTHLPPLASGISPLNIGCLLGQERWSTSANVKKINQEPITRPGCRKSLQSKEINRQTEDLHLECRKSTTIKALSPSVVALPRNVSHQHADYPEEGDRPVVRILEERALHLSPGRQKSQRRWESHQKRTCKASQVDVAHETIPAVLFALSED